MFIDQARAITNFIRKIYTHKRVANIQVNKSMQKNKIIDGLTAFLKWVVRRLRTPLSWIIMYAACILIASACAEIYHLLGEPDRVF